MELLKDEKRRIQDALKKYKDGRELSKEESRLVKQKIIEELNAKYGDRTD